MKRALVVFLLFLGACHDPPPPTPMAMPVTLPSAAPSTSTSTSTSDPAPPTVTASTAMAPAPSSGFVTRSEDGCTWKALEYCCPPKALCKPTPEPTPVACPPLAHVTSGQKPTGSMETYMEMRADRTCWTGPSPDKLHRTLCCHERYPDP